MTEKLKDIRVCISTRKETVMAVAAKEMILDYGPEIGGARKLYDKYLKYSDTERMTSEEKHKYVQKDRIWKKPDYEKLTSEGLSCGLCYFISETRKLLSPRPVSYDESGIREYIDIVSYVRDRAMTIMNDRDARDLYLDLKMKGIIRYRNNPIYYLATGEVKCFGLNKLEQKKKKVRRDFDLLEYPDELELTDGYNGEKQFRHAEFGGTRYFRLGEYLPSDFTEGTYTVFKKRVPVLINVSRQEGEAFINNEVQKLSVVTSDEKRSDGKKTFVPRQLQFVERNGEDYLKEYYEEKKTSTFGNTQGQISMDFLTKTEVHAKPKDFDEVFRTPSLEFGNWESQKDRQAGLDMAFNAFMDLADILGIKSEDISLSGTLKLAFGSRGHGNARAHYEPMRQVINLTRPSGAGALCHEWGHALDHFIGKHYSNDPMAYRLGSEDLTKMPEVFKDLVESFKAKEVTEFVDKKNELKAQMEKSKNSLDSQLLLLRKTLKDDALDDWDGAVKKLYENIQTVNPLQYIMVGPDFGNRWIEGLSSVFKKGNSNHGLRKSEKLDLSRLCADLNRKKSAYETAKPKMLTRKVETDYYKGSKKMAGNFRKSGGYWESPEEMFARAFDCYVEDKLREKGLISDYLTYYASDFGSASPKGEERKLFNKKFDSLFRFLKDEGVFHEKDEHLLKRNIA